MTFATALSRLIEAKCPTTPPGALRGCVQGETLMEYVRAATNDPDDHYEILQMQRWVAGTKPVRLTVLESFLNAKTIVI